MDTFGFIKSIFHSSLAVRILLRTVRVISWIVIRPSLKQAMPGARETLETLHEQPRYLSALLTGNIEPAAQLKIEILSTGATFRQLQHNASTIILEPSSMRSSSS